METETIYAETIQRYRGLDLGTRFAFVRPGLVEGEREQLDLPEQALIDACSERKFERLPVFIRVGYGRNGLQMVGMTDQVRYDPDARAVVGSMMIYPNLEAVHQKLVEILNSDRRDQSLLGVLVNMYLLYGETVGGVRQVKMIRHVESIDLRLAYDDLVALRGLFDETIDRS